MSLRRSAAAAVLAWVAATSAFAQSGTGGLRVVVIDGSDRTPMPGVVVTLSSPRQLVPTTSIQSDAGGVALFPVLRPGGDYVVEVFMPGYSRFKVPNIRIEIGRTFELPITLKPEMVETITVEATKGSVDLDKTTTSSKYSDQFIADLPVSGRLYQNVLTLAPGVQDADGDGNPNVLGARDRDFKATVNGVSNQDPLTGQWLNLVNQDSIEEVEVVQTGAGPEYGRAQGGFAQIIQKQGSNDFEGTFNFLFRSSKLDGNGATNVSSDRIQDFDYLQPSVSVSGPIVRDKLWYRVAYELLDIEQPVNLGSAVAVVTQTRQNFDTQVTWQISPRNKMAFQWRADPLEVKNAGVSEVTPPSSSYSVELGGPSYLVQWTAPYSPKLFVDTLVAYQDATQKIYPTTSGVKNNCVTAPVESLELARCFQIQTSEVSGSFPRTWDDQRQRLTFKSDGTYYAGRFWGANHEFKAGMIVENERYYRTYTRRPQGNFFEITPSLVPEDPGGGPPPDIEPIGIFAASFAFPETSSARAVGTSWSFYGSDQIKPLNNLTINVGFRFDREQIDSDGYIPFDPEAEAARFISEWTQNPFLASSIANNTFTAYEGLNQFVNLLGGYLGTVGLGGIAVNATFANQTRREGSINLLNNNFAPRFSVAWDPWSDGKSKFSASYGRYFDKIFLAVPLIELEPVIANINFDARRQGGEWVVNPATTPVNPALTVSVVDRNLRTPYQDEIALAFERELWTETTFRVTLVKRKFEDQLQDTNLNKAPADYGRCIVQGIPGGNYIADSPGSGQTLTDAFTGATYVDTDPGNGDGLLDDCAGALLGIGATSVGGGEGIGRDQVLFRPDGITDLYLQNPYWGDIYQVGNYNSSEFEGLILQLERRQYRNWQMDLSYTYSRAKGDAEDFALALGDDRSTLADERGYLSYDQRHVVKFNATTLTPWGFRLGTAVTWQSGLPYSILTQNFSFSTTPPEYDSLGSSDSPVRQYYPTGQRNDQRNRSYWNFDVKGTKEFNLPRGMNLQLSAEIFNLLNEGTYIVFNNDLRYGYQVNGRNDASGSRFGRQFQLGMRLAF